MPKGFLTKKKDPRYKELQAVIEAGLTRNGTDRAALSKKCGIPYSTLTKALREPEIMRYSLMIQILDVLGIPQEDRSRIL